MNGEGTGAAPHVWAANSLTHLHAVRALALVPVLIAALYNTGYQYLIASRALSVAEGESVADAAATLGVLEVGAAGLRHVLPVLVAAMLAVGLWERVFSRIRHRRFDAGVLLVAVVFTALVPPGTSLLHVAFVLSFAIVFGREVFGGEGKTFLNPALLAVALLQISFPTYLTDDPLWSGIVGYSGTGAFSAFYQDGASALAWFADGWLGAFVGNTQGMIGTTSVLAVLIGAGILLVGGVACWRLMVAQAIGVVLMTLLLNTTLDAGITPDWWWHLVLGSFAFGAVFVATDASSAAGTRAGRWVQGSLMGAAVVLLRTVNPSHPDSVVAVLLLGSMLAPLIDHVVVLHHVARRQRRHG